VLPFPHHNKHYNCVFIYAPEIGARPSAVAEK
jgi:hypothetical protein